MLKTILFTLSLAFLFIGCGEQSPTTTSNKDLEFQKPHKSEILDAINQARSQVIDCHDGLGLVGPSQPLTWNDELYLASYEHSSDLSESNTFSHEGSGTHSDVTGANNGKASLFYERIEANGYVDYKIVGENIAGGQNSIEEVMEAWLNSPEHCTNIMKASYSEVGVAIVNNPDSEYGIYWTQSFGSKK